jgi:HD-like signal output (HDOD) protein
MPFTVQLEERVEMHDIKPSTDKGKLGGAGQGRLETLQSRITWLGTMPTLPEAATNALAVANDPDCRLSTLAQIIERDPALATSIFRVANSPLFYAGCEVASLNQALTRMGLRVCKQVIVSVGIHSLFHAGSPQQRRICEALWEHSFAVACISRSLNRLLECGYVGEEFACGLAHDIGRILVTLCSPITERAQDLLEDRALLLRERQNLGTDHCSLGVWYGQRNNLPGAILSAIEYHHAPRKASTNDQIVGLVAAAEHLANFYPLATKIEPYRPTRNPGLRVLSRLSGPKRLASVVEALPEMMSHLQEEMPQARAVFAA